ncbi:MAG: class I SAM-dependent methyltransferase [Cytophagaceae bacterium]|nr:class I SAM-dependent methyltransferase [Cytophagaceae bacterium]MDW8455586.1 class I SAM-dependent methyltransferase [Cytophagaceae bacterium]
MHWFETWFDSPYYQLLYNHRNEQEASLFIGALISFLQPAPDARILDIPCGTGRHSVELHKKGFHVTGADLSLENIKKAQRLSSERLQFIQHDMRKPFAYHEYDIVLNLFTSFGYFDTEQENIDTLKNFSHALKRKGVLVVDYMNVKKTITSMIAHELKWVENVKFELSKSVVDGYIVKRIMITDGAIQKCYTEKVKVLYIEDFTNYLNIAGLNLTHVFGDYELNRFDTENSDRMILIAQKI